MCLVPITLVRKIQTIQGSITNVVPCGKCPDCLKRKYMSWAFRLTKEMEISTSAIFLTLTYNDDHVKRDLIKKDYQNFVKRLRKSLPNQNIKYYACGEYGKKTQRPHYHAIMFNLPQIWTTNSNYLMEMWGKGNILIAPCNIATIKYVTKYIMKELKSDKKEFSLMSKKMGLNYLTPQMVQYHQNNLKSSVTLSGGIQQTMPRYFKDRIFTQQQKILINEKSEQFRNQEQNQFKQDPIWINDQFRKAKKIARLDRLKL